MYDVFFNYSIFIIKILTIIFIIFIFITIAIIFGKKNTNIKYKINNINKQYINLQKYFYNNLNNKTTYNNKISNLKNYQKKLKTFSSKNLFILNFNDDINAKDTKDIKEIISIINLIANNNDEVLLKLTSSGGFVNSYGLAATQLLRLKTKKINLTISVDLIAASGGYLMASTANKIIASQFAIIGSIGVISVMPNFNKLLNKNNIDIEHHTAGKYKSTLNLIGKNTEDGRNKYIEKLNRTHELFKKFIKLNRPNININQISSGEYWYAQDALELNLIDKIETSDEFIINKIRTHNVYEIIPIKKTTLIQKLNEKYKSIIKLI